MSDYKREDLIYMAKICEQTERFDEMLDYMRQVLNNPQELSVEERNLLSVAYKNSVSNKRTSWRILDTLEKKEEAKAHSQETQKHLEQIKKFKQ